MKKKAANAAFLLRKIYFVNIKGLKQITSMSLNLCNGF